MSCQGLLHEPIQSPQYQTRPGHPNAPSKHQIQNLHSSNHTTTMLQGQSQIETVPSEHPQHPSSPSFACRKLDNLLMSILLHSASCPGTAGTESRVVQNEPHGRKPWLMFSCTAPQDEGDSSGTQRLPSHLFRRAASCTPCMSASS